MPKQTPPSTKSGSESAADDSGFLVLVRSEAAAPAAGPQDRGAVTAVASKLGKAALEYVQISPEVLQVQLSGFLSKMNEVVQKLPSFVGDFKLDEIELSVEVTAKGTIAFLGTGGELGAKGGLKFTLKRKPESPPPTQKLG